MGERYEFVWGEGALQSYGELSIGAGDDDLHSASLSQDAPVCRSKRFQNVNGGSCGLGAASSVPT